MDTLKTAVVVVLLLAVVYGVFVVLNKPASPVPQELAWHEQTANEPLQIDMGIHGLTPQKKSQPAPKAATREPFIFAELSPESDTEVDQKSPPRGTPATVGPWNSAASGTTGVSAPPIDLIRPEASLSHTPPAAPDLISGDLKFPAATSHGPTKDVLSNIAAPAAPSLIAPLSDSPVTLPDLATRSDPAQSDRSPASDRFIPPATASQPTAGVTSTNAGATSEIVGAIQEKAGTTSDGVASTDSAPSVSNVYSAASESTTEPESLTGPVGANQLRSNGHTVSDGTVPDAALREAVSLIDANKWYQALFVATKAYQTPNLPGAQRQQLVDLLDPLAAKVIYSVDHLLAAPHETKRGETLSTIAPKFQVTSELLANVNGIEKPDLLVPGTKLKVVRGPFRAEIDLSDSELTLYVGPLYAGRFPISVGAEPAPRPGEYRVQEKQPGRVYYAGGGRTMGIDDPANPYGRAWIGLGHELSIHGSAGEGESSATGCISLSPRDALDVYTILIPGSPVTIRP